MKQILVVDDEADILETIVEGLEIQLDDSDITILKSSNGIEALEVLKNHPGIMMMVTDINMPKMNGIQLTEKARSLYPQLPVIVFTGHGDLEEETILRGYGVMAMVKKPMMQELINEILIGLSV